MTAQNRAEPSTYASRVAARPLQQPGEQARVLPADGAAAGGGHDRGQGPHPLGPQQRHRLHDHAAHRDADDVRGLEAEVVQQAEGVVGHVVERVRRPGRAAAADEGLHEHPPGDPARGPRGAAGVAVVVADHEEPAVGQRLAELRAPPGHRAAEPHHQQQRLAGGVAERLVAELEAVGRAACCSGEAPSGAAGEACDEGEDIGTFRRMHRTHEYIDLPVRVIFGAGPHTRGTKWLPSQVWSHRWDPSCARPGTPGRPGCAPSRARAAR